MNKSSISSLTAADIMHRDLIVVSSSDTLREAMELMTENHVTGLPVVDSKSRCIGLISASDILNYEQEHAESASEANDDIARHFNMETQRWESVRVSSFALEEFGDIHVEEVMNAELVSVEKATPVVEIAEMMLKQGVHRVLVMDENQHLYGIISAIDFVQLFAKQFR